MSKAMVGQISPPGTMGMMTLYKTQSVSLEE